MVEFIRSIEGLENVSAPMAWALVVVLALIVIVSIVAMIVSIMLAIKYVKYNRRENSLGMSGQNIARQILDDHGLKNIKVSAVGSLMFGNSYSHFFKKVRLRRLTYKKKSISSLAMAAQKSSLAILDKEGDKDMKTRIKLVPIITFGPYAFVPLIVIGVLLDVIFFGATGVVTFVFAGIGIAFYVLSFVLSIMVLKTEKKAQQKAYEILEQKNMATAKELEMMKELFHLYNIQYINDLVLSFLELLYRVLMIIAKAQSGMSSSNSNNK